MSPEKRQEVIDGIRLINLSDNKPNQPIKFRKK